VHGLEPLVRELQQQARLPDACEHTDNPAGRSRMNQSRPEQRSRSPVERIQSTGRSERGRGERRTCVADDDVLEEVGIRHPRLVGRSRRRRSSSDSWGGGELRRIRFGLLVGLMEARGGGSPDVTANGDASRPQPGTDPTVRLAGCAFLAKRIRVWGL
jgi:hypothetical protein